MKRLLPLLMLLCTLQVVAQKSYSINDQNYTLKTEVDGKLSLLWNIIDGEYRYFSKKGEEIIELTNTKKDGTYQEEFRSVLMQHTPDYSELRSDVDLNLPSLKRFYTAYNVATDSNFTDDTQGIALKTRLGFFAGMTNFAFSGLPNQEGKYLPQLGANFEIIDDAGLKRHAVVFQLKQLLASSDYDVSSTQLSLNYRFKFVNTQNLSVYVNGKIAEYVYVKQDIDFIENNGDILNIEGDGGDFRAPFAFGLGADVALGNGFLTFGLYDLVALNVNDNDEFPIDAVVGYKFNL